MVKCDIFYFCVVAKGECVQGPSGRPQQEVKERPAVSAPDTERRLCHPGGGQGRPGGVWRGEFDAPQKHTDTFVQINVKKGISPTLTCLSSLFLSFFSYRTFVLLLISRTCCTQSFRTGRLWRRTHLMKSETMLSSKRVSFKSCCTESSTTEPPLPTHIHTHIHTHAHTLETVVFVVLGGTKGFK